MNAIELKFVLKLLGSPDYQASISKLQPNKETKPAERDRICTELSDRGLVAHSREIKRFKIAPGAQALLNQDAADVPLTEQQLKVLKACKEKSITPGDVKIPAQERQDVIQSLVEKGLIKVEKLQIKDVWLTDQGYDYLRNECTLNGSTTISLGLVQNYVNFLRKAFHKASEGEAKSSRSPQAPQDLEPSFKIEQKAVAKPSDEEILQLIKNLDKELGTENYLPIFYLREKVQPHLSREELDQALYRLQRNDQLDISSLLEAIHYTPEQIQAGIPQDTAGPLFFLIVNT